MNHCKRHCSLVCCLVLLPAFGEAAIAATILDESFDKLRLAAVKRNDEMDEKLKSLSLSYTQMVSIGPVVSKCRVFLEGTRVIAEGDEWVFCVTSKYAFVLKRSHNGFALQGVVTLTGNTVEDFSLLLQLTNTIGPPVKALFPITVKGHLRPMSALIKPLTVGALFGTTTAATEVEKLADNTIRLRYSTRPLPGDEDKYKRIGKVASVDGTVTCDPDNFFVVLEHNTLTNGSLSDRQVNEFQPLFTDIPMPVLKACQLTK